MGHPVTPPAERDDEPRRCGRCGQENPRGSRFCNQCGAPLAAASGAPDGEGHVARITEAAGTVAASQPRGAEDGLIERLQRLEALLETPRGWPLDVSGAGGRPRWWSLSGGYGASQRRMLDCSVPSESRR
jgi:hypothetical protein